MSCVSSRLSRGCRVAIFGLATIATVLAFSIDDADARGRRKRASASKGGGYTPPYASIVVDANSGRILQETNADSPRHPASLTKIMTLYLLFERLEAGKIKLDTPMSVSARAAAQSPTKLGLRPGSSLEVEDAIRGLVTKSANDASVVIAEALAGSEEDFATLMTKKARALGMSKTVYRNASGLPNGEQITTARDQALLGRAIQERFPRYYRYFATPHFTYRGATMRNHNRLLGKVEGVDGIKTGYTNASGFNLVSSVRRGNRHIVAVVLGGASAGARDARMRDLIEDKIADASTKRTVTAIAEASEPESRAAPRKAPAATSGGGMALASASSTAVTLPPPMPIAAPPAPAPVAAAPAVPAPRPGSADPIKPIAVKTVKVKFNTRVAALIAPAAAAKPADDAISTQSLPKAAPAHEPAKAAAAPVPAELPKAEAAKAPTAAAKSEPPPSARNAHVPTGWIVQIGAFEGEGEAKQRLSAAQSKVKLLGRADSFTEPVTKGEKTLYRARFAGFEKDQAEAVCKQLKRNDFACLTIKN